jgi:hypothetical protein
MSGRIMDRMDEVRPGPWRLAGSLLATGVVVSILAGLLHAESHDANDHSASFTAYANSDAWTTVHLGQFFGMALVCAGLVTLWSAVDLRRVPGRGLQASGLSQLPSHWQFTACCRQLTA